MDEIIVDHETLGGLFQVYSTLAIIAVEVLKSLHVDSHVVTAVTVALILVTGLLALGMFVLARETRSIDD